MLAIDTMEDITGYVHIECYIDMGDYISLQLRIYIFSYTYIVALCLKYQGTWLAIIY